VEEIKTSCALTLALFVGILSSVLTSTASTVESISKQPCFHTEGEHSRWLVLRRNQRRYTTQEILQCVVNCLSECDAVYSISTDDSEGPNSSIVQLNQWVCHQIQPLLRFMITTLRQLHFARLKVYTAE
jgi:hypothetical protein